MVVRMPIPIILAVGLIMLVVVGNQVVQIKAVMRGHEIDAGPWLAPAFVEQVAATVRGFRFVADHMGQRHFADLMGVASAFGCPVSKC